MRSTSAARVVDLPDPVGPVTRTRPWDSSVNACTTAGTPSSSRLGISYGIRRSATATEPR